MARVAVVAVGRDPVRRYTRDGLGGAEERLRRRHVAALAEQHIDERAGAVDRPVYVTPASVHLQICLVHVPAAARLAASAPPQLLSQSRGEFDLPLANRSLRAC